jgi:hypothetical protein
MADLRAWPGLATNADPHDIPPGAAVVQENAQCISPGKLTPRKGMRPVIFENVDSGTPADTADVIALSSFNTPQGSYVIFLNADGDVKWGKRPL